MAAAVVAPGVVATQAGRGKLQHLEGGTVREILVREGQSVRRGQVLFRLDPLPARVNAEIVGAQLAAGEALAARLSFERDGVALPTLSWPKAGVGAGEAFADQQRSFEERRASLQGQLAIRQSRIAQGQNQVDGLARERDATVGQLRFIDEELAGLRSLWERRLVTRSRLLALERERSRLAGSIGRAAAEIASARDLIEQTRRETLQTQQAFAEQVAQELSGARERLTELRQKSLAARDKLARIVVRAPKDGVVQNLQVTTIGEVLQPGATLLEIAPTRTPALPCWCRAAWSCSSDWECCPPSSTKDSATTPSAFCARPTASRS